MRERAGARTGGGANGRGANETGDEPIGTELPTPRELVIELAVMLAVGFALAALGPFGSFAMGSFATRLAYWLPAALGGYALVRPTVLIAGAAARRLALPQAAGLSAGVLAAAAPMTLYVLWLNGSRLHPLPPFEDWLQLYAQVALIGGVVTILFALLERRGDMQAHIARETPQPVAPATSLPEPTAFLSRLPAHLREDLVALEMEDHYVRVHASGASTLVLLRMGDAVSELAAIDGLRVHRSWWVARDAVERVIQDGRSVRLRLKGGIEAPVARDRVPALRAAGWL